LRASVGDKNVGETVMLDHVREEEVCASFCAKRCTDMPWGGCEVDLFGEVIHEDQQPRVAASRSDVRPGNIQPGLNSGLGG